MKRTLALYNFLLYNSHFAALGLRMSRLLSKMRSMARRPSRIQLLSDLHLEVGDQYAAYAGFPQTAPYLLLAGDVGRLADRDAYAGFLAAQARRYERVFLVLGNHEFWGMRHADGLDAARGLCAEPRLNGRVELLHRRRWDFDDGGGGGEGVSILGCTLWSRIPEESFAVVRSKVKDFARIEGWTPEEHVRQHEEDRAWLKSELEKMNGERERRRVLVATHHAPCVRGTSRPQHAENPWTAAFASEVLDGGGKWGRVRTWVFGHTHYCTDFRRYGVRVVANQRGYVLPGREEAGRKEEGEFDPGFTISVD